MHIILKIRDKCKRIISGAETGYPSRSSKTDLLPGAYPDKFIIIANQPAARRPVTRHDQVNPAMPPGAYPAGCIAGQKSFIQHSLHFGDRAVHTALP